MFDIFLWDQYKNLILKFADKEYKNFFFFEEEEYKNLFLKFADKEYKNLISKFADKVR